MILILLFANKNMAGLKGDNSSYCHTLCSIVFFALFCTGCVLLSQEEFLQETKCMLVDKSHSPFQCTGQIDVCKRESIQCLVDCNSSYYKLAFDFVVPGVNFNQTAGINKTLGKTACGPIDTSSALTCKCCTSNSSAINTCDTKSLDREGKYDSKCPPMITSNLDVYNQFEIGKSYQCWADGQGNVYPFDKSHFRETASIILIVVGGLSVICNLMYFVAKCRKGKCTCDNDDDDDEE